MTRPSSLTPSQIRGHWQNKKDGRIVRVMGVVEGHVVARYKGAMAFVMLHKPFLRDFDPTPRQDPERDGGDE